MQRDRDVCYSLILAVCEGRLERVRELISSVGLSYSQNWADGYVLLCDALKNNHTKIAKLLLTNGSKVNSINENPSMSPLHFAVRNGDIEIVEMLVDRGANIDAECKDGTTPLHGAVRWEKMEIVKLLLNRGARVNAKSKYRETYLHIAADAGYLPIVEQLLKHGADVNSECTYDGKERCSPLYLAVINEHETVVKLLLEFGANIDAQDQDGKTILYFAVEKGHSLIIEHLLKHSPDVNNISNRNAFNVAVLNCREEYSKIAENLLLYGFIVNLEYGDNCKLLHGAISKGYLKIVEELLKFGVDIDYKNGDGKTALHIVSGCDNPEVVQVLLEFGADIDSKDGNDRTALHIASETSNLDIVKVLLKFGASTNSKDKNGRTALHIATARSDPEFVKVLLEFGADIDSKDRYGKTALLCASEKGNRKVVEVLLEFGADICSKDDNGKTALHTVFINYFGGVIVAFPDTDSDINIISERSYPNSFFDTFKRHVVKLKAANLYIRNKNLLSISNDTKLNEFRNECEKEVASMKSEKVGNANISFYDILTKGISQLVIYAGNESIVQVFKSDDYKIKFPIYATLINSKFRNGEKRKELVEQDNKIFYFFSNSLGIPYDCTEKVFNYLSDEDLRSIMDACKPISISSPTTDHTLNPLTVYPVPANRRVPNSLSPPGHAQSDVKKIKK